MEVKRAHTAAEMAHKYAEEHGTTKVTLPEEFKRHTALFSEEEANEFPPSRGEGDHKVVLLDTAPAKFNCKVYPMSQKERETEDKFLDDNLAKGYIVPSDSPYGFSTFMVPKKDSKEMQYIIDYRPLNAVTRKDVTPLPTLDNVSKIYKEWNSSANSTFDGAITTFAFTLETSGKQPSRHGRGLFEPKVHVFRTKQLPRILLEIMHTILEPIVQEIRPQLIHDPCPRL